MLTQAGEGVLEVALGVEAEVLRLDRRVLGQDARLSGPLKVTTLDILVMLWRESLAAFSHRYPAIALEVSADNQIRNLNRREADVALRATNSPPDHLVGRRVGRFDYAPFIARGLLETLPEGVGFEGMPWVVWGERMGARVTWAWMRAHVPDARIACRVDSSVVLIELARAGVGAVHLPVSVASWMGPELVQVGPINPDFSSDLWVLTHPDLRHTARVKAFTEHMSEAIRAWFAAQKRMA